MEIQIKNPEALEGFIDKLDLYGGHKIRDSGRLHVLRHGGTEIECSAPTSSIGLGIRPSR